MNFQQQVRVRISGHSCLTEAESDYLCYKVSRSESKPDCLEWFHVVVLDYTLGKVTAQAELQN